MSGQRGAERWQQRRRAVRRVGWSLAVLLLVVVAFAVWLALDAPDTRMPEAAARAPLGVTASRGVPPV